MSSADPFGAPQQPQPPYGQTPQEPSPILARRHPIWGAQPLADTASVASPSSLLGYSPCSSAFSAWIGSTSAKSVPAS
ncbi:hypothetical protein AHiyo8_19530 [Arthrobacter sp. Hiyo8]|nr:hypothetical protein AHiyo8_19530 [Arthrobacter sp. Hiyo8]